mgnify:CR=1 FL=1
MKCVFGGSNARTNEEYRQVVKMRMRIMVGLVVIGIITAAVAVYAEFYTDSVLGDHTLGVYTGVGFGLIMAGTVLFIKHLILLNNEEKLKESRLSNTDERIREIEGKAFRAAASVMIVVMYLVALIGGIYNPELIRNLVLVMGAFILVYVSTYSYYNRKM